MRWARGPLPWLGALLALYLLAPIFAFLVRLRGGVAGATGVGSALATSLVTATISAAVIAVLGVPLAYMLARARGAGGRILTALVSLPLALPPLMSGLLLLYVIGPRTALGGLFAGKLTETRLGIVLAQTFVAAPFLVISARAAFTALDPALDEMAAAFGHGRLRRFARVAVPGALPGIVAGLTLSWLRAFGEFGATVIVAYHPFSLPVYTFVQFDASGLPATTLPIALALAAALAVLLALGLPLPRARRRAPQLPAPRAPLPAPAAALCFALRKRVGSFSLEVASGGGSARLALLGSSGAGKTLTLRMLTGLTSAEPGGRVELNGRALERVPAERRPFGYVPQGSALLPRRSVWQQVTFGVHARPPLAAWWIERLGLAGLEGRYPEQLSGGQHRRVALARALATAPAMLLLDEPFTGLDAPVRHQLRRELRRLQRENSLSSVIVTHDPEEAALLADEVVVLDAGRVLQAGPRERVFRSPQSPRVAALMGIANTRAGVVCAHGRVASNGVELSACTGALPAGSPVVWCVRPERLRLDAAGAYEALLLDDADLGSTRELTVALAGALELTLRTDERAPLEPGTWLRLALARQDVSVWPARSGGDISDLDTPPDSNGAVEAPAYARSTADVGHLDLGSRGAG